MGISGVLFLALAYTRLFARTGETLHANRYGLQSLFSHFVSRILFLHHYERLSCKISSRSILYWIECRRVHNGRTLFQFSRKSLLASPLEFFALRNFLTFLHIEYRILNVFFCANYPAFECFEGFVKKWNFHFELLREKYVLMDVFVFFAQNGCLKCLFARLVFFIPGGYFRFYGFLENIFLEYIHVFEHVQSFSLNIHKINTDVYVCTIKKIMMRDSLKFRFENKIHRIYHIIRLHTYIIIHFRRCESVKSVVVLKNEMKLLSETEKNIFTVDSTAKIHPSHD